MYIGPGAGFTFLGTFLSLVSAVLAGILSLLLWPFRMAWLAFMRPRRAQVRKAIFLGFEGIEPAVAEKLMAEGKLPNLARLRDEGSYRRLRTTIPPQSRVAWATFATGVNPGKHNVFDAMMPRKGESFWKILGQHAVRSTILLVPDAAPPERFNGRQLSAPPTTSHPRYYAIYLKKLLGSFSTEAVLASALRNTRRGVVACVFGGHPRYDEMDRILGETFAHADAETALFVLSGHGAITSGGVDLNAWLLREGYGTRACACGPCGISVNRKILSPEEARDVKKELIARLSGLAAIARVYDASEIYRGPYVRAAPDIVIACGAPQPGVLFSNLKITTDDPGMEDMAPTVLTLFGVKVPAAMEGRPLIAPA
jgi:hypothetical protein